VLGGSGFCAQVESRLLMGLPLRDFRAQGQLELGSMQ